MLARYQAGDFRGSRGGFFFLSEQITCYVEGGTARHNTSSQAFGNLEYLLISGFVT